MRRRTWLWPCWIDRVSGYGGWDFDYDDHLSGQSTNNRVLQEIITPAPPADGTDGSNTANGYDLSVFPICRFA